jgi:hypothetical protein
VRSAAVQLFGKTQQRSGRDVMFQSAGGRGFNSSEFHLAGRKRSVAIDEDDPGCRGNALRQFGGELMHVDGMNAAVLQPSRDAWSGGVVTQ